MERSRVDKEQEERESILQEQEGEYESFVSLINATGEIVTLQMNEELSPGVKLIGLNPERAVFEKGEDSYLVINFKNQIKETSEPF